MKALRSPCSDASRYEPMNRARLPEDDSCRNSSWQISHLPLSLTRPLIRRALGTLMFHNHPFGQSTLSSRTDPSPRSRHPWQLSHFFMSFRCSKSTPNTRSLHSRTGNYFRGTAKFVVGTGALACGIRSHRSDEVFGTHIGDTAVKLIRHAKPAPDVPHLCVPLRSAGRRGSGY